MIQPFSTISTGWFKHIKKKKSIILNSHSTLMHDFFSRLGYWFTSNALTWVLRDQSPRMCETMVPSANTFKMRLIHHQILSFKILSKDYVLYLTTIQFFFFFLKCNETITYLSGVQSPRERWPWLHYVFLVELLISSMSRFLGGDGDIFYSYEMRSFYNVERRQENGMIHFAANTIQMQ